MNDTLTNSQVTFLINKCSCIEFKLSDFAKSNKIKIESGKYGFNFTINLQIVEQTKSIEIDLEARVVSLKTEKSNDEIASIKSVHSFQLQNFNDIAIKTDNGIQIPQQLMTPLLAIALSSLRGMLSVKLEGSIYENAIIPVIDVTRMMPIQPSFLG